MAVPLNELVALRARLSWLLRDPSLENARAQSVLYYLIEAEIQRNVRAERTEAER